MSELNGCELAVLFLYHLPATGTYYMWHRADIRWVENMENSCPAEKRATAAEAGHLPHHIHCQFQVQRSDCSDPCRTRNQKCDDPKSQASCDVTPCELVILADIPKKRSVFIVRVHYLRKLSKYFTPSIRRNISEDLELQQ